MTLCQHRLIGNFVQRSHGYFDMNEAQTELNFGGNCITFLTKFFGASYLDTGVYAHLRYYSFCVNLHEKGKYLQSSIQPRLE